MPDPPSSTGHIAVIGMSGRFPDCENVDDLWEILKQQKDTHQEIPHTRFNLKDHHDATGTRKNTPAARHGCFLSAPGTFDTKLFNISPVEAAQMDPLHRLFLTTTYEALEHAGYNPLSSHLDKSRVSTYFAQSTDDWKTINEQNGIKAHYLQGTNRSFAPGRVGHYFGFGGGCYSVDTGCSGSASAVHLACRALDSGECDVAVVGGGNVCVVPGYFAGFAAGGFLSGTGGCRTFWEGADGYCRGEAVGTVVLRRVGDAVAANDRVLGVVVASARNGNAGDDGSITYPGSKAQGRLLEGLLERGRTGAGEIGFVEMHGTGTQAGDLVEMGTVRRVLGGEMRDQPVYVGAVKANVGHGEAAAGITALIKALLMIKHDYMPGQPGELKGRSSIPRSKVDGRRKIIINSFDAAGGNTSILLQDVPSQKEERQPDPRTHHVVTISGRTAQSLQGNRERLQKHLQEHAKTNIADLAYTTTARRIHHIQREAYVVESAEQLINMLKQPSQTQPRPNQTPSLVFVFTGQSSQYTAMGSMLYKTSSRFRGILDGFDGQCMDRGFSSFIGIIRGTVDIASAAPSRVQLATVALEIALEQFLQGLGLQPTLVIGHSLGEYAALCVAGALSVSDTLYLVHERAALMEKHCVAGEYGMLAVSLGAEDIQVTLREVNSSCEICCVNGPDSTVIGGLSTVLDGLQALLKERGLIASRLNVPYSFHTKQMDAILPEFEQLLESRQLGQPIVVPVASTLTGAIVSSGETIDSSYLTKQCRQGVNFMGALKACKANGSISDGSIIVEIGPHPVCTSLLASTLSEVQLVTLPTLRRGTPDWKVISECLATAHIHHQHINWEHFHEDYLSSSSLVDLPSYAFDIANFWTPYRRQTSLETPKELDQPLQKAFSSSTACLQRLELISEDRTSATFTSDLSEPTLLKAIQGHIVDGAAICPASIFIDMAYGAAQSLLASSSREGRILECVDLQMITPLVLSENGTEQTISIAAQMEKDQLTVKVRISSLSQGTPTEHAICQVISQDSSTSIWPQVRRLVQYRVDSLSNSSGQRSGHHKMAKALMYKLFDSIVEYSAPYRILEDITVDQDFQDAVAELGAPSTTAHGRFTLDPYAIDSLIHLPGFLLNCNFDKPKGDIHIAKSVERVVVMENFRSEVRPLTLYASISSPTDANGTTICDAYLFKGGEIAALVSGISFQRLSRQTLSIITGGNNVPQKTAPISKALMPQKTFPNSDNEGQNSDNEGLWAKVLRIVATTTGVSVEEAKTASSFTELGVDSHMAIAIIAQVNREARTVLPAAFFNNFPTLAEAEGRAILLQGNPDSSNRPFFLVTESSGSVSVYTHFPPLPSDTPIYGIESPFLSSPQSNTLALPELAKTYIATMRTIQPTGPYLVGGYSFAAVYAYEMAYQLALLGERLQGLIIIDMYVPPPAHNGTSGMKRFSLDGIGQGPLANITTRISQMFPTFTDNQKEHMRGSMAAASVYTPEPIPKGLEPYQAHLIWAMRGVNENGKPEEFDPDAGDVAWMGVCEEGKPWSSLSEEEMGLLLRSWFFAPRRTFGDNGWGQLVGRDIEIHMVDADHLSLVAPPKVKELGKAIARAVELCSASGAL
ncbi:hypothetical protein BJY04DRAFT_233378 [Aspergillus karnatakaensis]|uniref:uncharacterized protein n=1 Tax=Aspergillus karnatakaensis TaxID=1810916 RepID=UPI003CCD1E98